MEKHYSLPYGKGKITFHLPEGLKVSPIRPKSIPPSQNEIKEIERALDESIGTSRLEEMKPRGRISIVISDLTRPVPHRLLLPPFLKKLDALRIPRSLIKILIATGQHSKVAPDQFHQLVDPSWAQGIEVISKFQSEGFKMGLHKAFLFCRSLIQSKVYFYSEGISSSVIKQFFLEPISSVQEGVAEALFHLPPHPKIAIMPKASSTFVIQ